MAGRLLRINVLFQPVAFDLLAYVAATWLLMRALRSGRPREWLLLGTVVGAGLLTKYTMLLFVGGAAVGLLLTPHRSRLATPWPWAAALIAMLLWSPNLVWQYEQGWPVVEHMTVLAERQLHHVEPAGFLLAQVLMGLSGAPVWLAGLWWTLRGKTGKPYRILGWLFLSNLAVLLVLSGKAYCLVPAYPMLLAAGAVALEEAVRARRWRVVVPVAIALGSVGVVPIAVPVLSVQATLSYARFGAEYLGFGEALRWEDGSAHGLPQDFADMLGWEELAAATAHVAHEVPGGRPVYAGNYGEAGALQRYALRYGLPQTISGSSSFWLWGFGEATGDPMVVVGVDPEDLQGFFGQVEARPPHRDPHAREREVPLAIVREPRQSMEALWARLGSQRY